MKYNHYVAEAGRSFGYPECCVVSFAAGIMAYNMDPVVKEKYRKSVFNQTGYIPCSVCVDRDHKDVLREIDSRRFKALKAFLPHVER